MWLLLGVASSFFLGFHEIFKKVSLQRNAVLPVLFFASLTNAIFFLIFIGVSFILPDSSGSAFWFLPQMPIKAHVLFLLKSLIVSLAWLFGYFSVKNLPVTMLAPVNASGPVWTIIGAMAVYNERLNVVQWTGVIVSMAFYYWLSFSGNIKGQVKNAAKWLFFAFLSIIFNSASALLDKYLVTHYNRMAMQAYFSVYTALLLGIILVITIKKAKNTLPPFFWRQAIPMIGLFLIAADYFYFYALSFEGAMVSILIIIRRASAIILFMAGTLYFRESNIRQRAIVLAGILTGVVLVVLGSLI
jgi:transporter family protein